MKKLFFIFFSVHSFSGHLLIWMNFLEQVHLIPNSLILFFTKGMIKLSSIFKKILEKILQLFMGRSTLSEYILDFRKKIQSGILLAILQFLFIESFLKRRTKFFILNKYKKAYEFILIFMSFFIYSSSFNSLLFLT